MEILAEFQYKIDHRNKEKHENADGLNRQQCADCKKCKSNEVRDGDPTREQIEVNLRPSTNSNSPKHGEVITRSNKQSDQKHDFTSLMMAGAIYPGVSSKHKAKELAKAQQCSPLNWQTSTNM